MEPTTPQQPVQPGVTIAGRHFGLPWIIGGVALVLVMLICGCCGTVTLASTLNGGKTTAQATATHGTNAPHATATLAPAKATATVRPTGPQTIHAAMLGGTESDFSSAWGAPTHSQSVQREYLALVGNQFVHVNAALTHESSNPRFWSLIISPSDASVTWDKATAETVAKTIVPSDARYIRDLQVPDFGTEHVYVSASLAVSFPASQFTDATTGTPVAPGTFYISCGNQLSVGGGCTIQTGQ